MCAYELYLIIIIKGISTKRKTIPTGNIRMAPIYDLAGAFASSQGARDFLSTVNQATLMIVYFLYLIDNIIEVYNEQKKYLNEIACV